MRRHVLWASAVLTCAFGCSAGNTGGANDFSADSGTSTSARSGAGGSSFVTGSGGSNFNPTSVGGSSSASTSSGPSTDCAEATKLVYVVSEQRGFYSFDPGSLVFTKVGVLHCPAQGATPFSMAVDRNGTAWVLYSDSSIWAVDINTAACTQTTFGPQDGFRMFGMGFATNAADTDSEKLYLANYSGRGLSSLDTTTMRISPIGPYDQLSQSAELTGTGDGRLFGFFETDPINIAQIDPTDAHILSQAPQPSVAEGTAWAFAFWGGSFYLFTAPNGDSIVTKYDPTAHTTEVVLPSVGGFTIVGAGVSTCAPLVPPH